MERTWNRILVERYCSANAGADKECKSDIGDGGNLNFLRPQLNILTSLSIKYCDKN